MKNPYSLNPEWTSRFQPGQIIRHFKRDFIDSTELAANVYVYKVLAIGKHTETGEEMLVYQALYSPFETYIRPLAMAEGPVDKEKYPNAKQERRLEIYTTEMMEEEYGL